MANFGYGKGYQYAHDAPDRLTDMRCLPENLKDRRYYRPTAEGFEAELQKKIEAIQEWKRKREEQ